MHVCSTRASRCRRQDSAKLIAAILAAFFISSGVPAYPAQPAETAGETDAAVLADRKAAHEVRLEVVEKGQEGLDLSARLTETGGLIQKPIFWTVVNAEGELIYKSDAATANLMAEAGDYEVTARYGTVTVVRTVTLAEQQRIGLTFVLNVGGIRVLPRIDNLDLNPVQAETAIYSTSGRSKGRLIARSTIPGEIVRLGAGSYRIESQFMPGNASSSTDVSVEAGMMSSIDLSMAAGIARLTAVSSQDRITWSITDIEGNVLSPIEGATAEVALKPGTYTARALIGTKQLSTKFTISSGESREIKLDK
jgi:hypothetical protein